MSTPAVSVIIPVFNRRALIRDAVSSALTEGSRVPLEVIVVDDCSTDDTWDVVSSFGDSVRPLRLPRNGGQSAARNAGLDLARGRYVKFLDSDDLLAGGHLEKEVARAENESADIVVSGWSDRYADGSTRDWNAPEFHSIVDDVLAGIAVPTSAALYLREKGARWDESLRKLDDWDFFSQSALGATTIATESGVAYWMCDHAGQRATDVSMLINAREHHIILRKIEERLAAEGKLTESRRRRLAQYYYKEMRVLSIYDREGFEKAMRHIFELDRRFRPVDEEGQAWMRVAARLFGPRRAILLHSRLKMFARSLRRSSQPV